ncbi:MAG: hypothetical protein AAB336_14170 [Acidobacteriota bacterium]
MFGELKEMSKKQEKTYKDKYPQGFIDHYLAMYSLHRSGLSNQDFRDQNELYIECEGQEEFQGLIDEIVLAEKQEDLSWFLKSAISNGIDNIDLNKLKQMFEAIKHFNVRN